MNGADGNWRHWLVRSGLVSIARQRKRGGYAVRSRARCDKPFNQESAGRPNGLSTQLVTSLLVQEPAKGQCTQPSLTIRIRQNRETRTSPADRLLP